MELKFLCIFCMILCGWTFEVAAKSAECVFDVRKVYFDFPNSITDYACYIKSFDLSESNEQIVTGVHDDDKSDEDVKIVYCYGRIEPIPIIDINFCQKFKNLEGIQLQELEIEQVNPKTFEKCQNLRHLDLKENKITEIPENLLSELPKLITLKFYTNQISSIAANAFKNQKELEKLSLGVNKISSLPPKVFKPLINLKELEMSNNQLTTIHSDSFGIHRHLKSVNFYGNKINAIDVKFIDNTAVEYLDVVKNFCIRNRIESRDEMKEKLQKCFENYQPRPAPVTSVTPNK